MVGNKYLNLSSSKFCKKKLCKRPFILLANFCSESDLTSLSCHLSGHSRRPKRHPLGKTFLKLPSHLTPFENAQRWMGKNTFPILLLNDDNMIG